MTVTLTGTGELTAVNIRPGSFDSNDTESLSDLGDLVVAAYRDGKAQGRRGRRAHPRSARRWRCR